MPSPTDLTDEQQAAIFDHEWIDTDHDNRALTTFQLYSQPSRDDEADPRGSYQLYLPPTYDEDLERRYPVIYWLHGGWQNSRQDAAVERIDRGIQLGKIPPSIVVVPQALPTGWYVDSKDGVRPIEQVIAVDLVDHVDSTYRTVADREARMIEGFSMGGYGAFHLAFKYPKRFATVSSIAPSILRDMAMEDDARIASTFFGDHAYYQAVSPWNLLLANAPEIRKTLRIRLMIGTADTRLTAAVAQMRDDIVGLGIPLEYYEVPGAEHEYEPVIDGIGESYYQIWHR